MNFTKDKYGFWRQDDPAPFTYTEEYKQKQGTNEAMSAMRVGWLASHFSRLNWFNVVDVGCGNGAFVKFGQKVFKSIKGYDVVGESISEQELLNTKWDMAVLSDVIEHMPDMEYIFKIPWEYAYLSFPETPEVNHWEELTSWRHFKPNEHLWCLNLKGMMQWFYDHKCRTIASTNMEDLIRKPWAPTLPNISSLVVRRMHE